MAHDEPPTSFGSPRTRSGSLDLGVIARCQRGDAAAWRELVQHYRRLVYSIPRRAGLEPEACDDVFQDVFTIVHAKLGALQRDTALPKWIATTTHRVTLRWLHRQSRDSGHSVDSIEAALSPDESVARWELHSQVREALDELGLRCRTLLDAMAQAGDRPDYGVLAERLGMPVGSLGPTRARCLSKLLKRLRDRGVDRD